MFKNAFPPDAWGTARQAYDAAHAFGYAFAWHFGPTHGTGDIRMLEVTPKQLCCSTLRLRLFTFGPILSRVRA